MERKIVVNIGRLGLAVALLLAALSTLAASPAPIRHPSGLEIVPPLDVAAVVARGQMPQPLAMAATDALELAQNQPNNFGYPFVDRATGKLILSAANAAGSQSASTWTPRSQALSVARSIRKVTRTYAALEKIRHEAIGPGVTNLPGGKLIWMTTADEQNNRVLVVIDHLDDALLFALAARYGTEAIAVRIEKNPGFGNISRQDDQSPFFGGARIDIPASNQQCSTSFGFVLNGYDRMVTAGHCVSISDGGYVYSHASPVNGVGTYGMGWIYSGTGFYNWGEGVGTRLLNGSYDGDMALVTLDTNRITAPQIYTGTQYVGDETHASVVEMWTTTPAPGDQYCTGGETTGQLCGWVTTYGDSDVTVAGGVDRNVATGQRSGCVLGGDSGGAVYTVRPDGGIAAKGIMSQANTANPCQMLYTDVRRVVDAWPGITLLLF
jgi:hypothetical protein